MKSLLTTLVVLCIGLASTQLQAQSCAPCPPQCCTVKCCAPNGKSADVKSAAACTPEQMKACAKGAEGQAKGTAASLTDPKSEPVCATKPEGEGNEE